MEYKKTLVQQVRQSGAGGGGDGIDIDFNTELNATKLSLECFKQNKEKFSCSLL